MSLFLTIHPENPQIRLIQKITDILKSGGILIYPTDSVYAIGCKIGEKRAVDRIRMIRGIGRDQDFTLLCRNLSEVAKFAKVSDSDFRILKAKTPGPVTFLLPASSSLPTRLFQPKRKVVGIRIPKNNIVMALLTELDEPLMSLTFAIKNDPYGLSDPNEIRQRFESIVDGIIDGGYCGIELTSVVDLTGQVPKLVRMGLGDLDSIM
ncbi:MAG: threonylcarbamoyl-AMP synthase [Porticoccaceae bacterium]|nr:threonylcarbamoyl-AMP synthase [Porticoccaceae bacterium]|tara:strand:- start:48413 stop:49033 length:621 start_codon:yes stop_codon:yes gene_type:complete